jgi:hypothetical protein
MGFTADLAFVVWRLQQEEYRCSTFNADGKLTGATTPQCTNVGASPIGSNGTWALTGSKLKITDGSDVEEYDVSLNGNTLKLSQTAVDDYDGDGKTETGTISLVLTKV